MHLVVCMRLGMHVVFDICISNYLPLDLPFMNSNNSSLSMIIAHCGIQLGSMKECGKEHQSCMQQNKKMPYANQHYDVA